MRIENVRGIVTGAARGLGRHFALELARCGAHVVAGDIDTAGLRQLKSEAAPLPGNLVTLAVDVADEPSVISFVDTAWERLGGLNVLINNAGVLRDGLIVSTDGREIRKLPATQWRKVLDTNLSGQFLMAREVVAKLIENKIGEAVVVNISSLARAGNLGQSSYAASKAGLDACTRTWALEFAQHGIRVGGVAPGVIDTPILESISEEALAGLRASIPLGRIGRPEAVWLAVKFVIECDFFTARVVEVDGGATMPRFG
jgi:3-oxoacyl-[acyl-carrier protein] reductase